MTFQAYIDNIHKKTGKTPDDFRKLAEKKGLLKPGVKAMEVAENLDVRISRFEELLIGRAEAVTTDVSDPASIRALFERLDPDGRFSSPRLERLGVRVPR